MEEDVSLLNSKLGKIIEFESILKNGSNMLDEIFEVGKMSRNMKGKWFEYSMNNKNENIPLKKFVLLEKKTNFLMMDHMPQHRVQHAISYHNNFKNLALICDHYGRYDI